MSKTELFSPNWASPPGDTISDILRERHLSVADFAAQIGHTLEDVRNLLQGHSTITIAIARQLEHVLGASVEFWMSRDFHYRQDIAKFHAADKEWLAELPISDMIRLEWLRPVPHPADEVAACLHFFNVPSISAWREAYELPQQMVAFRTSPSLDSRPGSVAAWLRQGEIEAEVIECASWDVKRFADSLVLIRALTRETDPSHFLPELQRLCALCGVAVIAVRSPSGCRASGATKFLSPDKALLLLSFRYLSDDHFWFTFFHEVAHLLLHGDSLFLEGLPMPSSHEEKEANEFAALSLIPPEFQTELLRLPLNAREVIRFARRVGVSPGIIVGQMQYLGKIGHNQLNSLKRRYEWTE